MNISDYLKKTDRVLFDRLPVCDGPLSSAREMLRYSLEGGGKRVRPLLCLLFCEVCGGEPDNALLFAAAVEYVHTYSLIHDDLPCMDNDDFRRGKLSSHKKFGEANALLAGDALVTHAFSLIAQAAEEGSVSADAALKAEKTLSRYAGLEGMLGGQILDIAFEGKNVGEESLFLMDALKTGALMQAACELGCIAAGASAAQLEAARTFALSLGLAFQLTDDLLEYENGDCSDAQNEKSTYIALLGPQETRRLAAEHTQRAVEALAVFGDRAQALRAFAQTLLDRRN